jgi:serine/threonine protein kinase
VSGRPTACAAPPEAPAPSPRIRGMEPSWDRVRAAARGIRADYDIDSPALDDTGGQAKVFSATHKATRVPVAMKKLRIGDDTDDNIARTRREIEYGRSLDHPNVTPVLDAADDFVWFVMPLAAGNLASRRAQVVSDEAKVLRLVRGICAGLDAAHDRGWVHRDVKPENILRLRTDEGKWRWALADWGLGRGPQGSTTMPGRTRTGLAYGTEGYAAPELSWDAHRATAAADIYSVGQLIGWLVTGDSPQPNVPLLPPAGPWRAVVREATRHMPDQRPPRMADLLKIIDGELHEPTALASARAERLLEEANAGKAGAIRSLILLAENNPNDSEIYLDVLPGLSKAQLGTAVRENAPAMIEIMRAMARQVEAPWDDRHYKHADSVITFPVQVMAAAVAMGDSQLLEEALEAFCVWDQTWDQWAPQRAVRPVLRGLREEQARAAASILRRHPHSAGHLAELADDRSVDARIRDAVHRASGGADS